MLTAMHHKYPVLSWAADKEEHLLVRGEDFQCTVGSMKALLHWHARGMGLDLHTTTTRGEGTLLIRFMDKQA